MGCESGGHGRGFPPIEQAADHIAAYHVAAVRKAQSNEPPKPSPPGVMPERVWKYHRVRELLRAADRCMDDGVTPLITEWIEEALRHLQDLNKEPE